MLYHINPKIGLFLASMKLFNITSVTIYRIATTYNEGCKMKKLLIIMMVIGLLASVSACQTSTTSIISQTSEAVLQASGEEAADDLVGSPGGYVYAANVHRENIENPWPTIETTKATLEEDAAYLRYRDYITTEAGERRNNILDFMLPDTSEFAPVYDLILSAINVPEGIEIVEASRATKPFGGVTSVLVFIIAPDTKAGIYDIQIAIELDGKDYGPVPCTIEVL
jgi:hypothetical protein